MPQMGSLLILLLTHGPEILGDVEALFNTIAQGTGGPDKVAAAIAALEKLLEAAKGAVTSA